MNAEQVISDILEELEECSNECVKEGYPSHGSNYELRASNIIKWYLEQYPEYADDIYAHTM